MLTNTTDLSFLPGVEEFMKGQIEYVSLKKDRLTVLLDTITLQADMIQRMAFIIEKMLETFDFGRTIIDPQIDQAKENWEKVTVAFNSYYDGILVDFLKQAKAIGLDIDDFTKEQGTNKSLDLTEQDNSVVI